MASPSLRHWRRRGRRSLTLVVNVHKAIRLAGGLMPFAALAWSYLTTQGLNYWLTWLIGAVSWGQRANALWYQRWLAAENASVPVSANAPKPTLVVFSTTGLAEDALVCYLEAVVRAQCPPQMDRLLVTDTTGRARVEFIANATRHPFPEVISVAQLSAGIVAQCARSRFEAGGAGRYRLLVLLRPGYLLGEMPLLILDSEPDSEDAVLYYGDEDCVDARGQRQRPFFKCGYSPDMFMHQDCISSWMALTNNLVARLSPSQPVADYYDLALMLAEAADRVEHVGAFVAHRHLPSLGTAVAPSSASDYLRLFLRNRYGERAPVASHDAGVACRPDVGLIGALLLYAAGTIQHAGLVTGFGGCVGHIYAGVLPSDNCHMFVSPTAVRNVSAVTGACMAVSRRVLDAIGPFDENYRVVGGDVEICLRALAKGLLNVYLPEVELLHLESQSRSLVDPESDVAQLKTLIANGFSEDVWYNRRLSMVSTYPSYPIFPRRSEEAGVAV